MTCNARFIETAIGIRCARGRSEALDVCASAGTRWDFARSRAAGGSGSRTQPENFVVQVRQRSVHAFGPITNQPPGVVLIDGFGDREPMPGVLTVTEAEVRHAAQVGVAGLVAIIQ